MGLRTGGLSAPSNQLKAKSWREMDGWGIEALPSSTVGDAAAETPPRARFRTPARFMPKRCLMGLRTGGRSAPSNQLIAKSWRDGWMGYRSFAVQHRRRFGCRNTSEGTVAKRQNPSKIRAQAQQKTVRSAGPKQHLWSPLRRRKEPQRVDHKHGAT